MRKKGIKKEKTGKRKASFFPPQIVFFNLATKSRLCYTWVILMNNNQVILIPNCSESLSAVGVETGAVEEGGILPVCYRTVLPSCFHTLRQNSGYVDEHPAPASSPSERSERNSWRLRRWKDLEWTAKCGQILGKYILYIIIQKSNFTLTEHGGQEVLNTITSENTR